MTSIADSTDRTLPRAAVFTASAEGALKHRRRLQGLAIAFGISGVVWAGVITGIVALVNALN